jgi:hypothetical protein
MTSPRLDLTAAELGEACVFLALLRAGGWPETMRIRYGAGGIDGLSASLTLEDGGSVLIGAALTADQTVNGYVLREYRGQSGWLAVRPRLREG